MTINQRIKFLRHHLQLSQAKFAQSICISNGFIADLELDKRKVNPRLIRLICLTYGVREDWLANGTGEMFPPEHDPLTQQAINNFNQLEPKYQKYFLQQLDELLKLQNCKE